MKVPGMQFAGFGQGDIPMTSNSLDARHIIFYKIYSSYSMQNSEECRLSVGIERVHTGLTCVKVEYK